MNKNMTGAAAKIYGSVSNPTLFGTVKFKQMRSGVMVTAEIFNLPHGNPDSPDIFAFHIHEGSRCAGTAEDPFADAKSHYNPGNARHPFHAGDLPPLFGNNGYAYMCVYTDRFAVKDIIGRVIIIHARPDDFTTQPSGNSGEKIACGKITAA